MSTNSSTKTASRVLEGTWAARISSVISRSIANRFGVDASRIVEEEVQSAIENINNKVALRKRLQFDKAQVENPVNDMLQCRAIQQLLTKDATFDVDVVRNILSSYVDDWAFAFLTQHDLLQHYKPVTDYQPNAMERKFVEEQSAYCAVVSLEAAYERVGAILANVYAAEEWAEATKGASWTYRDFNTICIGLRNLFVEFVAMLYACRNDERAARKLQHLL